MANYGLRQHLPQFLYHGTTEAVARRALKDGLRPRSETGKSNWEHTAASHPEMVYLSHCYAPYFCFQATDAESEANEYWGIVEIDTSKLLVKNFYPDEDSLTQLRQFSKRLGKNFDFKGDETVNVEEIIKHRSLAAASLRGLGNCCYHGAIPAKAISRVAIYDPTSNPNMTLTILDPTISIVNHHLCGKFYDRLTQWFFGKEMTTEQFYNKTGLDHGFTMPGEQMQELEQVLLNRSGLEIIDAVPQAA